MCARETIPVLNICRNQLFWSQGYQVDSDCVSMQNVYEIIFFFSFYLGRDQQLETTEQSDKLTKLEPRLLFSQCRHCFKVNTHNRFSFLSILRELHVRNMADTSHEIVTNTAELNHLSCVTLLFSGNACTEAIGMSSAVFTIHGVPLAVTQTIF